MTSKLSRLICILAVTALLPSTVSAELKIRPMVAEYQDANGNPLKNPEGVSCSGKGEIVVADTGNGRLVKYRLQGETLSPGIEIRLPQIVYPIRLASMPDGDELVLDGRTRKIIRVASDGTFKGFVEIKGAQLQTPVTPKAVATDSTGQIYILDISGRRVFVLDTAGSLKRTLPVPADAGFISDIAVDPKGNVFALDSTEFKVFKSQPDKDLFVRIASNLNSSVEFPTNIAVDPRGGGIYITDQNGSAVVQLGPDGSFQGRQLNLGWKQGALYYPAQLCVSESVLSIADRNNNRLQLFTLGR